MILTQSQYISNGHLGIIIIFYWWSLAIPVSISPYPWPVFVLRASLLLSCSFRNLRCWGVSLGSVKTLCRVQSYDVERRLRSQTHMLAMCTLIFFSSKWTLSKHANSWTIAATGEVDVTHPQHNAKIICRIINMNPMPGSTLRIGRCGGDWIQSPVVRSLR